MELREALRILGPDRVRRGMRAIDDRRDSVLYGQCATCWVGEAFGGTVFGYTAAVNGWLGSAVAHAARRVEMAYEERAGDAVTEPELWTHPTPGTRALLRAECVAMLAECGDVPEPAPVRETVPA